MLNKTAWCDDPSSHEDIPLVAAVPVLDDLHASFASTEENRGFDEDGVTVTPIDVVYMTTTTPSQSDGPMVEVVEEPFEPRCDESASDETVTPSPCMNRRDRRELKRDLKKEFRSMKKEAKQSWKEMKRAAKEEWKSEKTALKSSARDLKDSLKNIANTTKDEADLWKAEISREKKALRDNTQSLKEGVMRLIFEKKQELRETIKSTVGQS